MARSLVKNNAETMLSEAHFLRQVCEVATLGQWMVYHTLRSTGSTAGYPDLCLVRGPDLLYAELKRQHGRVTPAQAAWLQALREVQHVQATVWRPRCRRAGFAVEADGTFRPSQFITGYELFFYFRYIGLGYS